MFEAIVAFIAFDYTINVAQPLENMLKGELKLY